MELQEIQVFFLRETKKYLDDNHELKRNVIQQNLTEACIHMADYQNKELSIPIESISMSFLNFSYYFNKPIIRILFFAKGMLWKEPLMYMDFDAEWLVEPLKSYKQKLEEYVKENKKKTEWLNVEMRRMLRLLLKMTSYYIKYDVREWCENEALRNLFLCDDVVISFGEYMDWQLVLHRIRQNRDIFQCDDKQMLQYTRFQDMVYKKKMFSDLDLTGTIFLNCTFTNCKMEQVIFHDAIFRNCVFDKVSAKKVQIYGASFEKCLFRNCTGSDIKEVQEELENITCFYKEPEWIECEVDGDGILLVESE